MNYTEPGSGDEFPDAGEIDSDDSDFVASGGTRTAVRAARLSSKAPVGASVFRAGASTPTITVRAATPQQQKQNDLDQSYLGMIPPSRFITAKPVAPTKHEYLYVSPTPRIHGLMHTVNSSSSPEALDIQARKPTALVPIRVEFETDTHRIRDCFVWNLHEDLIKPESFARTFCTDLDLPTNPWADLVAAQIRAQLEEHEGIAALDFGAETDVEDEAREGDEVPECRVILSVRQS